MCRALSNGPVYPLCLSHCYHGRLRFPPGASRMSGLQHCSLGSGRSRGRGRPCAAGMGQGRKPRGGEVDFGKWDYSRRLGKAGTECLRTQLPSKDSICCSLALARAVGRCPETPRTELGCPGVRRRWRTQSRLLSDPEILLFPLPQPENTSFFPPCLANICLSEFSD